MSAVAATALGLALATAAAVVVVLSAVDERNKQVIPAPVINGSGNVSQLILIDPNGPDVQFVLFTRERNPVNIKIGDTKKLENSGLNTSNPIKIIIHGFLSSIKEDVFQLNKKAYLESGNYNVIGMDWSVLCEFEYLSAMRGVQIAGNHLAQFVNFLVDSGNVSLDNIHIIGHSMGAHVAGTAGQKIKGKVGRITGLDPAGPGYADMRPEFKLDANDAKLVDVIHTHMRVLSLAQPLGHLDFYPNGGRIQPGCPDIYDIWKVTEGLLCNHGRAYHFFAESIRNEKAFKSFRCKSVQAALYGQCLEQMDVYMGQAKTYKKNGIYYVKTKDKSPFSY